MDFVDFTPIQMCEFVCRTNEYHEPLPLYRRCGADLSCFRVEEMEAYVNAGPTGSEEEALAEKQILDARGGVLPKDWTKVKYLKRNFELAEDAERVRLGKMRVLS